MIDKLKICKVRNVKTPTRGTKAAAGLDFFVPESLTAEDMKNMSEKTGHDIKYTMDENGFVTEMILEWGQSACIPSGIKANIPAGYCMIFFNKSGIGVKKGLQSGACVIDYDYLGEWHIDVHNTSRRPAIIKAGDKLAQFIMFPIEFPIVETVDNTEELFKGIISDRGEGWAGSTGTN